MFQFIVVIILIGAQMIPYLANVICLQVGYYIVFI